jgi:hypothetical protein
LVDRVLRKRRRGSRRKGERKVRIYGGDQLIKLFDCRDLDELRAKLASSGIKPYENGGYLCISNYQLSPELQKRALEIPQRLGRALAGPSFSGARVATSRELPDDRNRERQVIAVGEERLELQRDRFRRFPVQIRSNRDSFARRDEPFSVDENTAIAARMRLGSLSPARVRHAAIVGRASAAVVAIWAARVRES